MIASGLICLRRCFQKNRRFYVKAFPEIDVQGFKSLRDPSRKMRLDKKPGVHVSKLKMVLCASSYGILGGKIEFWSVSAI